MNETPSLYYNTAPVGTSSAFNDGVKSNRAALGAQVTLEKGDKYQKEIRMGGGFIRKATLRVHFGLGRRKGRKNRDTLANGLLETRRILRQIGTTL